MLLDEPPSLTPAEYEAGRARHYAEMVRAVEQSEFDRPDPVPLEALQGRDRWSQAVRCIELKRDYPRMKDAAEEFGVSSRAISQAIRKNGTCGGYHWQRVGPRRKSAKPRRRVRCVEMGLEYRDIDEVSVALRLDPDALRRAIAWCKPCGGMHFRYVQRRLDPQRKKEVA